MFIITMPKNFKVGSTLPCKVNGQKTTLTWEDDTTLVIDKDGKNQRRSIASTLKEPNGGKTFVCGEGTLITGGR
jgi:hypothetical protein